MGIKQYCKLRYSGPFDYNKTCKMGNVVVVFTLKNCTYMCIMIFFRPPSGGSRKSEKDQDPAPMDDAQGEQPSSRPGSTKPPSRPQSAAKSAGTSFLFMYTGI